MQQREENTSGREQALEERRAEFETQQKKLHQRHVRGVGVLGGCSMGESLNNQEPQLPRGALSVIHIQQRWLALVCHSNTAWYSNIHLWHIFHLQGERSAAKEGRYLQQRACAGEKWV